MSPKIVKFLPVFSCNPTPSENSDHCPTPQKEVDFPLPLLPQLSPTSLAYLGDAVYELYIRCYYLWPPRKISQYHNLVVGKVRAEYQAQQLAAIYPLLNDKEKEWVKRGSNAANRPPRRLPLQVYQAASGFETLLGYLYLCDQNRLCYILSQLEPK